MAARRRLGLITPTRLALGSVLLAVALAGETGARRIVLAFVVGATVIAFAALTDRRALLYLKDEEPEPLPPAAIHDPNWRVVVDAAYPSTFGVTGLAVVGLAAGSEVLAAALAGAVAGLGLASAVRLVPLLAWERRRAVRLYVGPHGRHFVD